MTTDNPSYFSTYANFAMSRTPSGVLTLVVPLRSPDRCTRPPWALYEIGEDPVNRVLVLTGTRDNIMTDIDGQSLGDITP